MAYNPDGGGCPNCKRLMVLVDWCDSGHSKCEHCHGDDDSVDCTSRIEKNYCSYCNIAIDVEE